MNEMEKDKDLAMQAVDIMKEMSEPARIDFLIMVMEKYEKEIAEAKKASGDKAESKEEAPVKEGPKPPMSEEQMMQFAGGMF